MKLLRAVEAGEAPAPPDTPPMIEGEVGAAMDARRDPRSGELAKMFPASINPRLAPNAGAGERASTAMDSRVHDRTATSLAEMFPDLKAPMKI